MNCCEVIPLKISESYQIEYNQTLLRKMDCLQKSEEAQQTIKENDKEIRLYDAKLAYLAKKIDQERACEGYFEN